MLLSNVTVNNSMLMQYGKISTTSSYVTWTQPNATGTTTTIDGGNMTITASTVAGSSTKEGPMNDSSTYGWYCGNPSTAWWQVKFPYNLRVTGLQVIGQKYGTSYYDQTVQFYTSSSKTTKIGNSLTLPKNNYTTFSVPDVSPVITDTIYGYFTSSGMIGMYRFYITAQKATSALNYITFPTSFSSTNYGFATSYIGTGLSSAYCTSRTSSNISLAGMDPNSTSAVWLATGY